MPGKDVCGPSGASREPVVGPGLDLRILLPGRTGDVNFRRNTLRSLFDFPTHSMRASSRPPHDKTVSYMAAAPLKVRSPMVSPCPRSAHTQSPRAGPRLACASRAALSRPLLSPVFTLGLQELLLRFGIQQRFLRLAVLRVLGKQGGQVFLRLLDRVVTSA
eukprot:5170585-Prymnesium_polylepis.2